MGEGVKSNISPLGETGKGVKLKKEKIRESFKQIKIFKIWQRNM